MTRVGTIGMLRIVHTIRSPATEILPPNVVKIALAVMGLRRNQLFALGDPCVMPHRFGSTFMTRSHRLRALLRLRRGRQNATSVTSTGVRTTHYPTGTAAASPPLTLIALLIRIPDLETIKCASWKYPRRNAPSRMSASMFAPHQTGLATTYPDPQRPY